jgi:hypothetical protein
MVALLVASQVDRAMTNDGVQPRCERARRVERRCGAPRLDHGRLDRLLGQATIARQVMESGGEHRPAETRIDLAQGLRFTGGYAPAQLVGRRVRRVHPACVRGGQSQVLVGMSVATTGPAPAPGGDGGHSRFSVLRAAACRRGQAVRFKLRMAAES